MFRIKICGITRLKDAQLAMTMGADAIGLNFYPKSKRFISHIDANFICQDLPPHVLQRVGVFVNEEPEEIIDTAEQLRLDYVQLHGDESEEDIKRLEELNVIRAIRPADQTELLQQVESLSELPNIKAILVDAFDANEYGGTGKVADWSAIRELTDQPPSVPIILAGGLKQETIFDAIRTTKPTAVDVASGVESEPGIKDPDKMLLFMDSARDGFNSIASENNPNDNDETSK